MAVADLLDLLYPRTCAGCGIATPDYSPHLCWECMAESLFVQPPYCSICGDPVAGSIDNDYVCASCSHSRPAFDLARSCVRYDGAVGSMIRKLKYRQETWLSVDLGKLLDVSLKVYYDDLDIDAVASVPLYHRRQRERGYNQAALLARVLAKKLGKSLLTRCLFRTRPTATQTNLTAEQRISNVRDAFSVRWRRWVQGRRLLLVDDVMTTGATVNECARVLKSGGAARVYVLSVARG